MKFRLQARLLALFAILVLSIHPSFAQTKFIINGAKVNMDTSVILSVNDLVVNRGLLTVVPECLLKVAGYINSASGVDAVNGTVEMNGGGNQQISANAFSTDLIKNMKINTDAEVSVLGALGLTDVLTLTKGNLAGGGYFALKSTVSKTARVAPVHDTAVVATTDVVVERYVPAKRCYRFLTAPVNTPGDIRANWQENANNTNPYININPNPGYGTQITGQGSSINGFDATNTNNPSIYSYNTTTQTWVRVPNTFGQLHAGEPFRLMVRGDRNTDLGNNAPPPSITTLRATGALKTGTVIFAKNGGGGTPDMPELAASNTGYTFIGNPYASAIDWTAVDRTDVTATMYVFDPTLSGSNGRGAYVTYNALTGINNPSSAIDNNIQSGQAFFIQNSGPNARLTVRETHKCGQFRAVFRTTGTLPHVALQLLLPGQDTTNQSADGVSVFFADNFDNSLGDEDSYKYFNPDENLSIISQDSLLSIEGRKSVNLADTVNLKIWNMSPKNYFFRSNISNFDPLVTPYLEDAYLQNVTVLNNNGISLVPFTVNSDTASYSARRFRIVFRNAGTLPLTFTGINAYEKNKGVQVDWTISTESNIKKYEVERSGNARQFTKIGETMAKNRQFSQYGYFDENPINGDNYYRIKSISNSGEVKYSQVVKVYINTKGGDISIVGNATSNSIINVQLKNVPNGTYGVNIVNNAGQIVYKGNLAHIAGDVETITLKTQLATGIYHLQAIIDGNIYSTAILIK